VPVIEDFLVAIGYKLNTSSVTQTNQALAQTKAQVSALGVQITQLSQQLGQLGQQMTNVAGAPTQKINQASQQINQRTQDLSKSVKELGLLAAATVTTFVAGFEKITNEYAKLYYVAQRTGTAAQNLFAVRYAGQQSGVGSEGVQQMLEAISGKIRIGGPGYAALLDTISGHAGTGAGLTTGSATDRTKTLLDFFEKMKGQPTYLRASFAQQFGIDERSLTDILNNLDTFRKAFDEQIERDNKAGINRDKLLQQAVDMQRQWNQVTADFERVWSKAWMEAYPKISGLLTTVDHIFQSINEFNQGHEGAATAEIFGGIAASIWGASAAARLFFRLLRGGAATAAASASLGTLIGRFNALGLAIGGVVAAIGALRDLNIVQGSMDPERWKGNSPVYGPNPDWKGPKDPHDIFDSIFDFLHLHFDSNSDKPHFAEGGIVPVNAHAGEIILPQGLSRMLLGAAQTYGSGGSGGLLGSLIDGFRAWWQGSPSYAPFVRILDAYGSPVPGARAGAPDTYAGGGGTGGGELGSPLGGGGAAGSGGDADSRWAAASKLIQQYESGGGQNIKNPKSSASGPWQILDSTWIPMARTLGIDTNKYPHAMNAPREVQERVARHLFELPGVQGGFGSWAPYNSRLRAAIARGDYNPGVGIGSGLPNTAGGNFSVRGNVDPRQVNSSLWDIVKGASGMLPPGYTAQVISGARTGGLEGSQHHGGNALDVQIYGPDGKPIANEGADRTGIYHRLAVAALAVQLRKYPQLAGRLAWGGMFETKPGSGIADLMHLDLGGDRGHWGGRLSQYMNEALQMVNNTTLGGSGDTHVGDKNLTVNNSPTYNVQGGANEAGRKIAEHHDKHAALLLRNSERVLT
jgi:hypothetical protein